MGFEWDSAKAAANLKKHGITFRQAAEIFRGLVLVAEDHRRDYGETRLIAIGEYDREIIHVVFTCRQQNIRIISAWKAGSHEREAYEKAKQGR